jgi:hypothetical protein
LLRFLVARGSSEPRAGEESEGFFEQGEVPQNLDIEKNHTFFELRRIERDEILRAGRGSAEPRHQEEP